MKDKLETRVTEWEFPLLFLYIRFEVSFNINTIHI